MTREVKFRGKRIDNGGWIGGCLVSVLDAEACNRYPNIVISYNNDTFDWIDVLPGTIGQFTGLKDRDGKEIYEGDILKTYPIIASDKIGDGAFNVLVEWDGSSWIANGILGNNQAIISKVVGNIYDNPELLNQ